tara:strand:+ start:632 stop:859 length:228 start_codon:yes stop_codon:yes gene_type:complete
MSDKIIYEFYYRDIDKDNSKPIKENIESRGYKKAVKSFQNKYPKLKNVLVIWNKNNVILNKLQKLPMGRKKKLEG